MCVLHNLLEVGAGTKHGLAQRAGGGSIVHPPQHHRNQLRWNSDEEKSFAKCVKWTPSNSKPMSLETLNILLYYFFSCTLYHQNTIYLHIYGSALMKHECRLRGLLFVDPLHSGWPTYSPNIDEVQSAFLKFAEGGWKIHKVQAFIPRCIELRQKSHGVHFTKWITNFSYSHIVLQFTTTQRNTHSLKPALCGSSLSGNLGDYRLNQSGCHQIWLCSVAVTRQPPFLRANRKLKSNCKYL